VVAGSFAVLVLEQRNGPRWTRPSKTGQSRRTAKRPIEYPSAAPTKTSEV